MVMPLQIRPMGLLQWSMVMPLQIRPMVLLQRAMVMPLQRSMGMPLQTRPMVLPLQIRPDHGRQSWQDRDSLQVIKVMFINIWKSSLPGEATQGQDIGLNYPILSLNFS